jgi:hypothetical protein
VSDPAEARRTAGELVASLRARRPELLAIVGADIGPALEQQLFIALRDGRTPATGTWPRAADAARGLGRLGAAFGAGVGGLVPMRSTNGATSPMVVLVREPVHLRILAGIEAELVRLAGEPPAIVRVGRAAGGRGTPGSERLARLLDLRLVGSLAAYQALVGARLASGTAGWPAVVGESAAGTLRRVAAVELPRIGLGAVGIASLVRRWRPSLLSTFDEVGTWARILPAVARANAIPSLDLPHAEAARAVEIRGAGYDRFAVYGSRAAGVLREAGVDEARIVEIGAPAFDSLVSGQAAPERTPNPRGARVVFASQYITGAMTAGHLEASLRAALAAAAALAPSELVVVPHPAEPPGLIAGMLSGLTPPGDVTVSVSTEPLTATLRCADLMVTGWSNSVFEAALLGVPAIMVEPAAGSPVPYAAEGLATGVTSETDAATAARRLRKARSRGQAVARARAALEAHLGPLDGRAAERAARLMLEISGRYLPGRAAA